MTAPTLPFPRLPDLSPAERLERVEGFHERMRGRRSCRRFSPDPVPRAIIETAILTAGTAPSGANHQPWHFAVVESADARRRLREAAEREERAFYDGRAGEEWLHALGPLGTDADKPFLEIAPYAIVVFGQRRGGPHRDDDGRNYYVTESVGIACGLLIAALHGAGLATLTHTPNPMGFLNELCGRPPTEKPVMIVVAGLPADDATVPVHAVGRKPLGDIASWV